MEHIKDSLSLILKGLKEKSRDTEKIPSILNTVLDEKIRKHITGYRKYKTNLIVYIDSSIWSFHVGLFKNALLSELKKGKVDINTINIKLRIN